MHTRLALPVRLAGVFALLAPFAPAQTVHAPRLGAANGNAQDFLPLAAPVARHQTLLDPGSFSSRTGLAVRELELRLYEGARAQVRGGDWVELELRMAEAPQGLRSQQMSSTFAANVDAQTEKTLIARKRVTLPQVGGPFGPEIRLPFDSPQLFVLNPLGGRSVVVEFRVFANQQAAWLDLPLDAIDQNGRVDILPTPTACVTSTFVLPNQFADPTRLLPGASNHEHYGFTGVPGAPCIGVFGFSDLTWSTLPLPFDLAPFGAPSCLLGVSMDWMQVAAADNTGQVRFPLAYPNDPNLRGVIFFTQILVLDAAANALGLATSTVLQQRLGGDPEAATLTDLISPTATTGQLTKASAPVFAFR